MKILSENEVFIFIEKAPGEPVFPWHKAGNTLSVLEQLLSIKKDQIQDWPEGYEGGIGHRLDNSTSGLIIACKNPKVLQGFRRDLGKKRFTKIYELISKKDVPWSSNIITIPIAHDLNKKSKMVVMRGKSTPHRGAWFETSTEFSRITKNRWEVKITTGVMHQIRVHAAFVGLPIMGDKLYGGGIISNSPPNVTFLLHHKQIVSNDWSSPVIEAPNWWNQY